MKTFKNLGIILLALSVTFSAEAQYQNKRRAVNIKRTTPQQEINAAADEIMPTAPVVGPTGSISYTPVEKESRSVVTFVPVVGKTFSTLSGSANTGYSFSKRDGSLMGIGILFGRGTWQFETGLNYAERGGNESYSLNYVSWDMEYKNKYLEVPLLGRYNYRVSKDISVFAKAGLVLARLQDSEGSLSNKKNYYQYYYATSNNLNSTKSSFEETETRWALGAGASWKLTRSISWMIQADYQESLGNVSTSQPNGLYGTTSMNLGATTYGFNTGLILDI